MARVRADAVYVSVDPEGAYLSFDEARLCKKYPFDVIPSDPHG
jgi:hypothetical protein